MSLSRALLLAAAAAAPALAIAAPASKSSLCHGTGSASNPYTVISVASSAVGTHTGHGDFAPFTIYEDLDGDGYGDGAAPLAAQCSVAAGYSTDDGDCDDAYADVNPGASEVPYDGIDNDCVADSPDDDLDGDGWVNADDCNDSNSAVNPSAAETAYDGIDNDCNASTPDDDVDGDGYLLASDCNDANANVSPAATEIVGNGIDDDCNAATADAVAANSWNAADDFGAANPSGVWSYGYTVTLGGFTPYASYLDSTLDYWYYWDWLQVYANTSASVYGNCADWCLQPGTLAMHPANWGAKSVTRFTAPTNGAYIVDVVFSPIDRQATGITAYVVGPAGVLHQDDMTAHGDTVTYTTTVTLLAGQTVDFAVGYGPDNVYYNDGTDLDATVEGPY